MNVNDLKWSKEEKKIARAAFDRAYEREIAFIRKEATTMLLNLKEDHEIWKLEEYLWKKRREIDHKYDYRYSQLIFVFATLLGQGWLKESDLEGLSEDKLERIKRGAEFYKK